MSLVPAGAGRPEIVTREASAPRRPWIERATSADHKSVALIYIGAALLFAAAAAAELALMRVQLIVPESGIIAPEIFDRLMTVGGTTAVLLFAVPLALGLIGYVVPLQIGSRGVALPRLGLLSAWLYIAGAATIYASFVYTPPGMGAAALPPLSGSGFSPDNGADAWIAGVSLATCGFVLFAVNLVATVTKMRAPGLAWRRVPPFAWAGLLSGIVLLIVGPAMLAALVMLFIDRNFDGVFFAAGAGGAPLLYQHLAGIFFAGIFAVILLFAAGVISEILPSFSRKPLFSHRAAIGSLVAIAALTPLAWMQGMYSAPLGPGWTTGAMVVALALVIPIGMLLAIWIATLWRGALSLRAAHAYALAAISTLAFGLALELMLSVMPVGWMLEGTTFALAAGTYVVVGAIVLGGFAALHYWFGKLTGRILGDGLGKAALAAILIGVHVYALPLLLAGVAGQPAEAFQYFEDAGLSGYNLVSSIGAFILVLGVLLALGNVAWSYGNGRRAPHDPWGGATLEWFALSPPPPHNFDVVPDVRSPEPMREIREAVRAREAASAAVRRPQPVASAAGQPAGEDESREPPVA